MGIKQTVFAAIGLCVLCAAVTSGANKAVLTHTIGNGMAAGLIAQQQGSGYSSLAGKKGRNAARPLFDLEFEDVVIPGALNVYPWDINNAGDIAGFFDDADGNVATFYRVGGVTRVVRYSDDHPGTPYNITSVSAISESRDVLLGNWGTLDYQKAGYYIIATRQWVELPDIPGYKLNFITRANPSGTLIGDACANGDYNMAWNCISWIWDGSQYVRTFAFDGVLTTLLNGINSAGEIVGFASDRSPLEPGFRWRSFTGLAGPRFQLENLVPVYEGVRAAQVQATDINDAGAIVGIAEFDGVSSPFWSHRGLVNLLPQYPSAQAPPLMTGYFSINARGEMFGYWLDETFQFRAFIARPKPLGGR